MRSTDPSIISEPYQQILAAFTPDGPGLRAKDVCRALGIGTEPKDTEGIRAKLKRLTNRQILTETEPGLFTLAQNGRNLPNRPLRTTAGGSYTRGVVLADVVHRPLRIGVAALWLLGAGLAGVTAPVAAARLGVASGLVFAAVTIAGVVFAVSTLRCKRWALAVGLLGCGGQVLAVAGTVWELAHPIDTAKSRELQALGVDPTLAVTINLVYSAVALLLFMWMAIRLIRIWTTPRRPASATSPE